MRPSLSKTITNAISFLWLVIRRAWSDTIIFFGWNFRTILLVLLVSVVAFTYQVTFPRITGFADYIHSGIYTVIVAISTFPIVYLTNVFLAPSKLYFDLKEELAQQKARKKTRNEHLEAVDILQRRYDEGREIAKSKRILVNFDNRQIKKARIWHERNLEQFRDLIPPGEYHMYKTIAPEPDMTKARTLTEAHYHNIHSKRLEKLRRIIGRLLDNTPD